MKTLFWLGSLILFMMFFMLGYVSLKLQTGSLNIMPHQVENPIIMGFSVLGMLKSLFEMRK